MEKRPAEQRETASPRRIVFLDIDGVLNSEESMKRYRSEALDPMAVARLRKSIEPTGAQIVITSSRRKGNDWRDHIKKAFDAAGWPNPPILDRTPILNSGRGTEIAAWLREYPGTEYVIIDDDDFDLLPDQMGKLIRCDATQGFRDEQGEGVESVWGPAKT